MKTKTAYVCQECGYDSQKWLGKCPGCNNWSTMVEEVIVSKKDTNRKTTTASPPILIKEISTDRDFRIKTEIGELDQVLGGGVVEGSLILIGGEPGIGKSTLLLQICSTLSKHGNILYITGEESEKQIKMRADRLGKNAEGLYIVTETNLETAMAHVESIRPKAVIVDSVQTMFSSDITSASGSVSQVREVTMRFMRFAKETATAVFLVGHVTKDGSIAGPRVLEHMVDCVLYFEGERHQSYRILRAVKNRYGSTNEIGVFEIGDKGLVEVKNPSAALLSERPAKASGSAVVCTIEGTRPLLAEIQALVTPTGFGIPRRMTSGIDYNRINLIIAILEKRLGANLQNQDVYINVIGGIKLDETATDLSVAAAIISSLKNIVISQEMVFLGELGLTGELRSISNVQKRVVESAKLGFRKIVLPYENAKNIDKRMVDAEILPAKGIREAFSYLKEM